MFKEYKATILLAVPVVIGQLSSFLMNIMDNIFVGHLGHNALSAVSFANSCFYLIAVAGFGINNAVPALISEARGANNQEAIRQNLRAGIESGLITGVFIGIVLYLLALAMPYMQQPAEDVRLGQPFLFVMAISAPFMVTYGSIKGFFDGMEKTEIGMIISIFGLALNAFLNYTLIFGKLGFPELGFIGSAYATLISRVVLLFLFSVALLLHPISKPYNITQNIDRQYLIKNLKLGIPMGLQIFFEVAAFSGAGIMIGWLEGENAIIGRAAHQIALNMASATYIIMIGISVAGSVRVGEAFGRKNWVDIKKAGLSALHITILLIIINCIILYVFREQFCKIYGISDAKVVAVTTRLIIIAAVFQIFDGIQCVSAGLLRGLQDVKIPTLITFLAYWVIWIPVAYCLAFILNLGVDGIWYGDVIALAFAAISLTLRYFNKLSKNLVL